MIIKRTEEWGTIEYNTSAHYFIFRNKYHIDTAAYSLNPVLLNVDLTMKCNMSCMHCVAKDFHHQEDLLVSQSTIKWINKSPFMVIVITGGEPLLSEYETQLVNLLKQIKGKGLIIDTNGTILPSKHVIDLLLKKDVLVRVSLDSLRPQDEIYLRQVMPNTSEKNKSINKNYYEKTFKVIRELKAKGIKIAIQSVLYKKNILTIQRIPDILSEFSIDQWYIQRLIPSYKIKNRSNLLLGSDQYNKITNTLIKKCESANIKCIVKRDKRHNSVFLLVGNGLLYTQGEQPGQKILLGNIASQINYFDYVSAPDHADRYYR